MTGPTVDIKDRSPNEDLVSFLERMLDLAKSGELRSALVVTCYDDCSVNHSWRMDKRNSARMMLAQLIISQHELITALGLSDDASILAQKLRSLTHGT